MSEGKADVEMMKTGTNVAPKGKGMVVLSVKTVVVDGEGVEVFPLTWACGETREMAEAGVLEEAAGGEGGGISGDDGAEKEVDGGRGTD